MLQIIYFFTDNFHDLKELVGRKSNIFLIFNFPILVLIKKMLWARIDKSVKYARLDLFCVTRCE